MKDQRIRVTAETYAKLEKLAVEVAVKVGRPVTVAQVVAVTLGCPMTADDMAGILDADHEAER